MALTPQDPHKAVITSVGSAIGGGTASSSKPVITGTADAGTTVDIFDGVRMIGTALVDSKGNWSFTPTADLKAGSHSFTAISVDSKGDMGASSTPMSVTVPAGTPVGPVKPVIDGGGPTDDAGHPLSNPTNDPRPEMSGTGTPGDTITMYDGNTPIGSTIINDTGNWVVKPEKDLDKGNHDIYVIETNPAGVPSVPSDHYPVVIDTSVPAKPSIPTMTDDSGATIPAGSTTADAHPHINGTGTSGDIIKVYDGSTVIGSTTVGGDGKWSFTPSPDLGPGAHDIHVTETNLAGTSSPASDSFHIEINTSVPATPATPTLSDDSGATIPAGSTTTDAHPHINGTGTAGDIIKVYDGSTVIGSTTIGSDGKWTFTPGNMSVGSHSINVTETNAAGTSSAHSGSIGFTYSNVPPAPSITSVVDAVGPVQGNVPSGGVTDDPRVTISGTGVPGDTVYVYLANTAYGGQPYGAGTAYVDTSGHWSVKLNNSMAEGVNTITALQFVPPSGSGPNSASTAGWVVTLNTSVPAKPSIPTMTDDSGATIPAGSTTADAHPHINGTGTSGDIIKVYDGSTVIGSTTVGGDGKWSFTPSPDLGPGTHDIHVTETNLAGTSSPASDSIHVVINTSTPAAPVVTSLVDANGIVVPSGGATSDDHLTMNGTGAPGDIVKMYDGQEVIGSAKVDANGLWSITPTKNLSDAIHDLYAIETNAAGKSGPTSAHIVITVDTSVPATPAAPTLTDDNGATIPAGSTTADMAPHISGTGKAGDIITVYDGNRAIGSTTVGEDGTWTLKPSMELGAGGHDIRVVETNLAGTSSPSSDSIHISVNTTVPVAPSSPIVTDHNGIQVMPDGSTSDAHLTLSGTGVAGDMVKVYDGDKLIGSATIDSHGKWSLIPSTDLSNGRHSLTAVDINSIGSSSPASSPTVFTIDTALPPTTNVTAQYGVPFGEGNYTLPGDTYITSGDTCPSTAVALVFDGQAPAGASITFYVGGKAYPTNDTSVSPAVWTFPDGRWRVVTKSAIASAGEVFRFTVTVNGVEGAPAYFTVFGNAASPVANAPTLTDDHGLSILASTTTSDAHPNVSGKGQAGDTIFVYDGKTIIGTTTVGSDGKWVLTPSQDLSTGNHSIYFIETTPTGGTVAGSVANTFHFAIDTSRPGAETAPLVTDHNDHLITGLTLDPQVTLSGVGAANNLVLVFDGENVIGSTTVKGDGTWKFPSSGNLSDGSHSFSVVEVNSLNVRGPASQPTTITVNTHFDASVTAQYGKPYGANWLLDGTTFLTSGDAYPSTAAALVFIGQAPAGAQITFYAGGKAYHSEDNPTSPSILVTDSGFWRVITQSPIASAGEVFRFTVTLNGVESPPAYFTLFGNAASPVANAPTLTDDHGLAILASTTTSDAHPNVSGKGQAGDTIFVYDGKTIIGTTTVGSDGKWVFTPSQDLSKGSHSIHFIETTAAGGTVSGSQTITVVVNATPLMANSTGQDPVTDAAVSADSVHLTPQLDQHVAVGEHDVFIGKTANGNETVDLNADPSTYFKEATAHIQGAGGNAIDTLHLTGDHQVLDLTSLTGKTAAAKISGIEVVDLGGQHNTLKLSLIDVLNLGETDLFQKDGKQQMMVQGKDGDTVDLSNTHIAGLADGEWAAHGTTQVGGVTYNVYEHSGAHTELLVQQGVQIVVH